MWAVPLAVGGGVAVGHDGQALGLVVALYPDVRAAAVHLVAGAQQLAGRLGKPAQVGRIGRGLDKLPQLLQALRFGGVGRSLLDGQISQLRSENGAI